MKIGIAPSGRRSAADAVLLARLAESEGLAEVWVSEDYLERGAFAVAGAIAAVTERVSVGLGVINPWTRHVALTAMEAVALDEVSKGRAIIGLGASNAGWMTDRLGIAFERPISTLEQYSMALKELLGGQPINRQIQGNFVDAQLDFTPDRADIPIYWGVKGPRALERGTKMADGLILSVLSSPGYVRWIREQYRPRAITAYATFSVDSDGAVARDRLRTHTAQFLGLHGASAITEHAGIEPELAGVFRERLRARSVATELVTDAMQHEMTVSGTPEECAQSFQRFAAAGVDTLVVIDNGAVAPIPFVAGVIDAANRAGLG